MHNAQPLIRKLELQHEVKCPPFKFLGTSFPKRFLLFPRCGTGGKTEMMQIAIDLALQPVDIRPFGQMHGCEGVDSALSCANRAHRQDRVVGH